MINHEQNDELDGILALESDSDHNQNDKPLQTNPSGSTNIILESNDEPLTFSIGKKTKLNKSNWKRNITKNSRAEGVDHISLRNKTVLCRTTSPDCHYDNKCFPTV